ncbi:unnamed protein product, partial [Closterium sp. NIES-53]
MHSPHHMHSPHAQSTCTDYIHSDFISSPLLALRLSLPFTSPCPSPLLALPLSLPFPCTGGTRSQWRMRWWRRWMGTRTSLDSHAPCTNSTFISSPRRPPPPYPMGRWGTFTVENEVVEAVDGTGYPCAVLWPMLQFPSLLVQWHSHLLLPLPTGRWDTFTVENEVVEAMDGHTDIIFALVTNRQYTHG